MTTTTEGYEDDRDDEERAADLDPNKDSLLPYLSPIGEIGKRETEAERAARLDGWGPDIRWARERGMLNVQDPFDGTWHQIRAKEAPTGYSRLATLLRQRRMSKAAARIAPERIDPW